MSGISAIRFEEPQAVQQSEPSQVLPLPLPSTERDETLPSSYPTLVFSGALKRLQDELGGLRANPDRTYQATPASSSSSASPTSEPRAHARRRMTYMQPPLSSPQSKLAQPAALPLPPLDLRHARVRQKTLGRHPSCRDVFSANPPLIDQLAISPRTPTGKPPSPCSSSTDTHRSFRQYAPMFFSITNQKASFSSNEASEQIRDYIKTPGGKEQALNFFSHLYNLGDADWYVMRWNLMLADIVLDPESYPFIQNFIERKQINVDSFAKGIAQGFQESDTPLEKVIDILSFYIREELKKQPSQEPLLSPSLYRECKLYFLQHRMPHSFSITNQMVEFSPEKAREEILSCLATPNGEEEVRSFISQFFPLENGEEYKARWSSLLAELFLNPQSHLFIRSIIIGKDKSKVDLFAKRIAEGFQNLNTHVDEVIGVLSLCAQEDLKRQTPETMFRGTDLSTSLYREYGLVLLHSTMQTWAGILHPFWERMDQHDFCLKIPFIVNFLHKTENSIDSLTDEKRAQCLQKQEENFENNKAFFKDFLDEFYKTPIPIEFQKLVASQREYIYARLVEVEIKAISEQAFSSPEEKEAALANAKATAILKSEVRVCQLIMLRMLNPWLISLAQKEPIRQEALINLTKMIQALANQVRFGLKESTLEIYNPIYADFIEVHRFWIDNNFPLLSLLRESALPSSSHCNSQLILKP